MSKFKWLIFGVLVWLFGTTGGASARYTATLSDGLGPTGGTYNLGDVREKQSRSLVEYGEPCVDVTKTVDCGISRVGDEVLYTICVENCGGVDLIDVVVTDPRFGGVLAGFPSALTASQQVCVDFSYTIQQGDEPGPVLNQAHVEAIWVSGGYPGPTMNFESTSGAPVETMGTSGDTIRVADDSEVVEVTLIHPDFEVTTRCLTKPLLRGDVAEFEIVIANTGDVRLDFTTDRGEIGPFSLNPGEGLARTVTGGTAAASEPCNSITVTATIPPEFCDLSDVIEKTARDCCEVYGQEGCTPGFWKNHPDCWCGRFDPAGYLGDVFDIPSELSGLADDTLMEALNYHGGKGVMGKARNLLRQAVAGILNGCNDDIAYPACVDGLIKAVNKALATLDEGEITDLQVMLDTWNNYGCSIDAHCRPVDDSEDTGAFGSDDPPGGALDNPGTETGVYPPVTIPKSLVVKQSTPNPFSHVVQIDYGLPAAGPVRIEVYDVAGRRVASLVNDQKPAGFHKAVWDGKNSAGSSVPTGIYFYTVRYQGETVAKKMIMVD